MVPRKLATHFLFETAVSLIVLSNLNMKISTYYIQSKGKSLTIGVDLGPPVMVNEIK